MFDLRPNIRVPDSADWVPGYGGCYRCGTSWAFVDGHSTQYGDAGHGLFPLCEPCWGELTPTDRLPFYRALWADWKKRGSTKGPEVWMQIEAAVLTEAGIS